MSKRPLNDFLLGGPGHDGYAYQADVYCVDCGQTIITDLYAEDYEALLVEDTDSAPQPIFFGESPDFAQHCGECGVYMYGGSDEDEDLDKDSDEDFEEDEEEEL